MIGPVVLLLLVACSTPATQVVTMSDMLSLSGRQVVLRSGVISRSEVAWQVSHQAPWFMPSLSRVKAMTVPVGTTPAWKLALVREGADPITSALPDELSVLAAKWSVNIHNDEGSLAFAREIAVNATLQRGACFESYCEYSVGAPDNLLSFALGPQQIPAAPPGWPRPRSTFFVDVVLELTIEPVYLHSDEPDPALELELRFGLAPGEATVHLSPSSTATH